MKEKTEDLNLQIEGRRELQEELLGEIKSLEGACPNEEGGAARRDEEPRGCVP